MSSQILTVEATALPFLSQPPRPKKRPEPTQPLPRLPSNPITFTLPTFTITPSTSAARPSHIVAWATAVQPGSPDAPSPLSAAHPSPCSSLQGRFRGGSTSASANEASYIAFDAMLKSDVTLKTTSAVQANFGMLPAPKSPLSVTLLDDAGDHAIRAPKSAGAKTFFASRFAAALHITRRPVASSADVPALTRAPRRKAQAKPYQAAAFAADAELLAFGCNGTLENAAQRVLAAQAGAGGAGVPFRDAHGAWWRDADEPWEHARLRDGKLAYRPDRPEWVALASPSTAGGSAPRASTAASLSPCAAGAPPLSPASPGALALAALDADLGAPPESPVIPRALARRTVPPAALLVRPVRAGRAHLRQASYVAPDAVDLAFIPHTPSTPSAGVRTPCAARFAASARRLQAKAGRARSAGIRRRRPALLPLSEPPYPCLSRQARRRSS